MTQLERAWDLVETASASERERTELYQDTCLIETQDHPILLDGDW